MTTEQLLYALEDAVDLADEASGYAVAYLEMFPDPYYRMFAERIADLRAFLKEAQAP